MDKDGRVLRSVPVNIVNGEVLDDLGVRRILLSHTLSSLPFQRCLIRLEADDRSVTVAAYLKVTAPSRSRL